VIATPSTPAATRILVVDDDRMMRFNIADYLENNGDTVCEAGGGARAAARSGALRPAQRQIMIMPEREMLALILVTHRRLCAIDAEAYAVFQNVVTALEKEQHGS
jgi:CheY-like chemotaxis protein